MTYKPSLCFAFNVMKRTIPGETKNSALYEMSRKYISKAVSESNNGRPMSYENKIKVSKRTKDTVIVKDKDGNTFRVSVFDERYKSGELVFYRKGLKHKKTTIEKMLKNSSKGKVAHYNIHTNEIRYFTIDDNVDDCWVKGVSQYNLEQYKLLAVPKLKNKIWYYNNKTGKHKRFDVNDRPSSDWVKGRKSGYNQGMNVMNSKIKVVDLKYRAVRKVFPHEVSWFHGKDNGTSTDKTVIFTFNMVIFVARSSLDEYMKSHKLYPTITTSIESNMKYRVPSPHHNNKLEVKNFRYTHKGKTLEELGVKCYNLTDFELDKHEGYTVYGN
jgi:hypothetical protein